MHLPASVYPIVLALATLGAAGSSPIAWKACKDLNSSLPLSCGSLAVPLDYTDACSEETTSILMAKLSATKKPSKGSILLNFGGPGETGRSSLALETTNLRALTGGYYDLIAFDPRGTGSTLPFSCYKTAAERAAGSALSPQWGNSSDTALGTQWAASEVFAESCFALQSKTGPLIGTVFTVRDMMQIVDALDEDGLLRYWGFSYGTTLGATAAAMFPDKIDRIALDGVFNPYQYFYGYGVQEYAGTDKTISELFKYCAAAGRDRCAFARPNKSGADLEEEFYSFLSTVKYNPIPVGTTLVTYDIMKSIILSELYSPNSYPGLAAGLDAFATGNLSEASALISSLSSASADLGIAGESLQGIQCGDKYSRAKTLEALEPVFEAAYSVSRFGGDKTTLLSMQCARWEMAAKERYHGNFEVTTRHPALIVTNLFDPVAPPVSAHNLSAALGGSVVLEQNGFGHTSLAQLSACSAEHYVAYWVNGTLPKPGTVCQVNEPIFSKAK